MAYREVTMIEVKEVLRQWLAGRSRKAMAKWVGLDRNTIRRYLQVAEQCGLHAADGVDALTDEKLSDVLAALGTGPGRPHGEGWAICEQHRDTIAGFIKNRIRLTKSALKKGRPMSDWVFPSRVGAPLEPNRVREAFFLALKNAKLRRIRFHDMRHTFASWLIANGESLVYVKEQLGHHSIQITVDTYGHLISGANRKAVNALDDPGWERASGKPFSLTQSAICIGAENNA